MHNEDFVYCVGDFGTVPYRRLYNEGYQEKQKKNKTVIRIFKLRLALLLMRTKRILKESQCCEDTCVQTEYEANLQMHTSRIDWPPTCRNIWY